jgi:hypothetical protein
LRLSSTFGHSVAEVERSHQHVVIRETATWGAALGFGTAAVLTAVAWRQLLGFVIALFLAAVALYASVTSDFIADRDRRCLIVRRRIGGAWSKQKAYDSAGIDRVYVRYTGKGCGLAVRLKVGQAPRSHPPPGARSQA